jgi:hypothetical protein
LELFITGLIASIAAIGSGLARRHQVRNLAVLLDAHSSSIAELHGLQATVAEQLGPGSFRERVKLSAEIVCDQPLLAPWSGEPCVAFSQTVTHQLGVKTETINTDSEGKTQKTISWEQRNETLSTLERRCPFHLRQGAQTVSLIPDGADLELEPVFHHVDPPQNSNSLTTRSLGVLREEAIFSASSMIFVLAECSDADGMVRLQAPSESGLFVVRRGTEDDFSQSIRFWRRLWGAAASSFSVLALALFLLAAR